MSSTWWSPLQMGVMANLAGSRCRTASGPPVNLGERRNTFDILGYLQEKTKGNLEEAERGILREGLYHLSLPSWRGRRRMPRPGQEAASGSEEQSRHIAEVRGVAASASCAGWNLFPR